MKKRMIDILNSIIINEKEEISNSEIEARFGYQKTLEEIENLEKQYRNVPKSDVSYTEHKIVYEKAIKSVNDVFNIIKNVFYREIPGITNIILNKKKTIVNLIGGFQHFNKVELRFRIEIRSEEIDKIIEDEEFKEPSQIYQEVANFLIKITNALSDVEKEIKNFELDKAKISRYKVETILDDVSHILYNIWKESKKFKENPLYIKDFLKEYYLPEKKLYSFEFTIIYSY